MPDRLPVIAFLGTVGSGKTTQMELLFSRLRTKKYHAISTHLKSGFLSSLLIILLLKLTSVNRNDVYALRALLEEKPYLFRKMFKLWTVFDALSICLRFLLRVYIPKRLGRIVIVEEYIPATIADHFALARFLKCSTSKIAVQFLLGLFHLGGYTQIVFLDASTDQLESRWTSRGSVKEESDYLEVQRTILLSIARNISSEDIIYIDTTDHDPETTRQAISEHIALD